MALSASSELHENVVESKIMVNMTVQTKLGKASYKRSITIFTIV